MYKSFMPTLAELYRDERGPIGERKDALISFGCSRHAYEAIRRARARIAMWKQAFPDTVDPDKLNRFLLAKNATGAGG